MSLLTFKRHPALLASLRRAAMTCALLTASLGASAQEFVCSYTWPGESRSFAVLLDVAGAVVIVRGGVINEEYQVAANTETELLVYRVFTKQNSGATYPVGFSTMALDKKTGVFVYSNSFAGGNQNNHAKGSCTAVSRR